MSSVIDVHGLVKRYGPVTAVDQLSFEVAEGEVFALLGPNGAGKSTTVEILEGHRRRDDGRVSVLGRDPELSGRDLRQEIGIVLQTSGIDIELSVRESIDLYRAPYRRARPTAELIELVDLDDKADARVSTLSGGQRRRLDLAIGLAGDPRLLFLDEPTTGLDPAARRSSWDLLERLRSLGRTILLTTHYMDEVQQLADRVAVIDHGRIVAEGTPDTLGGREHETVTIRFRLASPDHLEFLPARFSSMVTARLGEVVFRSNDPTGDLHELTGWAIGRGIELDGLRVERPTLEDVYLRLIGEDASS